MISLQIKELKNFMGKLLTSDCFDSFLLEEATITTYNTFYIDGHIQRDFYTDDEWEDPSLRPYVFSLWKDMRPFCFSLIKGKRTPVSFKIVLHLLPDAVEKVLSQNDTSVTFDQIKGFVLTVRYDGAAITCTTGVSLRTFLPDKGPEKIWDRTLRLFLDKKEISYSE